jgi:hypothetical protein
MIKLKNHKKYEVPYKTQGLGYIFLCLFLFASFSPLYQTLFAKSTISSMIDLDSDVEKNESERETEDTKTSSEISKEYFLTTGGLPKIQMSVSKKQYFHHSPDLFSHHPEKDSPPPKATI